MAIRWPSLTAADRESLRTRLNLVIQKSIGERYARLTKPAWQAQKVEGRGREKSEEKGSAHRNLTRQLSLYKLYQRFLQGGILSLSYGNVGCPASKILRRLIIR